MATTVHVKNISAQTSEKEVRDFFSFCGKISTISVSSEGSTQSAVVTFEKHTAAKTALLLDNTQLGSSTVTVSSSASVAGADEDKDVLGSAATGAHDTEHDEVTQEDKPRSRIIAEYLAHGYTISDGVISRAIALDSQHGYSNRFTSALQSFDNKYHATEKTRELDSKYGVSQTVNQGLSGLNSYFEKALGTPTGQKVRDFYGAGQKQVLDVHNEARRLADLRSGKDHSAESSTTTGDIPLQDKSGVEKAATTTL